MDYIGSLVQLKQLQLDNLAFRLHMFLAFDMSLDRFNVLFCLFVFFFFLKVTGSMLFLFLFFFKMLKKIWIKKNMTVELKGLFENVKEQIIKK